MLDGSATLEGADPTIRDKVRFLRDPANYRGREDRIEVVETHFSWVFLTRNHAYKLKKPAHGEGFDFRKVEARRRNALTELRLNRRLAPKTYLGLAALTEQPDGSLRLDGDGETVDWLVQMVRLEAYRMLDRRLTSGTWHYGELETVAWRLAEFFARARRVNSAPAIHIAQLRKELRRAERVLALAGEPKLHARATPVIRGLHGFLTRNRALFCRRCRFLIDGHGDLRPEHVYLSGTPQIIDCLEFRTDLRRLDPISEIAFLALECDRIGPSPIATRLIRRYRERSADEPPEKLLVFYRALNAVIRARLAAERIAEPGARTPAEWSRRAAAYLEIAANACRKVDLDQRPAR
jgi:aminoglycoside phosphotransferase family enzyme